MRILKKGIRQAAHFEAAINAHLGKEAIMAFSPSSREFPHARYMVTVFIERFGVPDVMVTYCETIADVRQQLAFNADFIRKGGGHLNDCFSNGHTAKTLPAGAVKSQCARWLGKYLAFVNREDGLLVEIFVTLRKGC
jgi:hypothetical protein